MKVGRIEAQPAPPAPRALSPPPPPNPAASPRDSTSAPAAGSRRRLPRARFSGGGGGGGWHRLRAVRHGLQAVRQQRTWSRRRGRRHRRPPAHSSSDGSPVLDSDSVLWPNKHKASGQVLMELQQQQEESAEKQGAKNLLHHFERILHDNPLIDELGFLHLTHFCSLDCTQNGNSTSQPPEFHHRYFWCRDHNFAISSEILPNHYCAARDAYTNARNAPLSATHLMRHSKALLILCPDLLTAWNSRKMVLSVKYDFTKLKDELQLCALILSYSPKNESTWSHRRWVITKVAEQHQDMSELIDKESILVKEIAEKSKMNYCAWRHRCWLIPYMTRKQVLDELNKSTKWTELHVADNCCFHYRRSLLLALLDSHLANGDDSISWESEIELLWKEELKWDEMLIRRYQGRESSWNHRRFLSQWWLQHLLTVEETCSSTTSQVDLFVAQEVHLLSECLNEPADGFEESRIQAELSALYILWISKLVPAVKGKMEERLHSISMGRLKDVLVRSCRPENKRLWMNLLSLPVDHVN